MKYLNLQEFEAGVLLTINRPKALNALSRDVLQEFRQVLLWIEQTQPKALIITGAGEKAFVAGADIQELQDIATAQEAELLACDGQRLFSSLEQLPIPVIMAVNGYALGGGMELAMCGDIVLAAEHAQFGQPEINLGIIPGYGGTQRLVRLVGRYWAKYLCFTGKMLSAAEAYQLGLVQEIVPAEKLVARAKHLAAELSAKAPVALRYLKETINFGSEASLDTGLRLEAACFGEVFTTAERKEGLQAFLEKRKPSFSK